MDWNSIVVLMMIIIGTASTDGKLFGRLSEARVVKTKRPRIRRNDGTTRPECMFRGIKKKTKKQIRSDHRTDQAQEMTRPGNERNLI